MKVFSVEFVLKLNFFVVNRNLPVLGYFVALVFMSSLCKSLVGV